MTSRTISDAAARALVDALFTDPPSLDSAKAGRLLGELVTIVEDEVERKLVKFTPLEFVHDAHHWLILHGRYVCIARKPKCAECVMVDLCEYRHKTV